MAINELKSMPGERNASKKVVLNDSDVLTKSSWRHGAARSARKVVASHKLLPHIIGARKRAIRPRGVAKTRLGAHPVLPARVPAHILLMPGRVLHFVTGPKNKVRAVVQNQLH